MKESFDSLCLTSRKDCLDDFMKVEKMTGEEKYDCDHCDSKQEATWSCQLTHLPPVLNLQLNRFKSDHQKITTEIKFPVELEMSARMPTCWSTSGRMN